MWLARLTAGRARPEIREKFAQYQSEATDVPAQQCCYDVGALNAFSNVATVPCQVAAVGIDEPLNTYSRGEPEHLARFGRQGPLGVGLAVRPGLDVAGAEELGVRNSGTARPVMAQRLSQ
jgi:hypothetical protein